MTKIYIYVLNTYIHTCGVMRNSSVCRHLLWKCSFMSFLMTLQYIPGSSREKFWFLDGQLVLLGGSRPPRPFRLQLLGVSRFEGVGVVSEVLGLLG